MAPSTPRASGGVLDSARRMEHTVAVNMRMFSRAAKHTNFVEAVRMFASGKKATPDMAALIIQTNWRLYRARTRYAQTKASAATVQRTYRGHVARADFGRQRAAQRQIASRYRGGKARELHGEDLRRHRAAIRLQAAWRGKVARKRYKARGGGKRTLAKRLSFRRKPKPAGGASTPPPASNRTAGAGAGAGAGGSPLKRRAASFDRRPANRAERASGAGAGAGKRPVGSDLASARGPRKELLFVTLARNGRGELGLELDGTNTITKLPPAGAAAQQGVLKVGDTIASVDGRSLKGVLLMDVIERGKSSYSFDVWRWPTPAAPPTPPPAAESRVGAIRRALSFDRAKGRQSKAKR